MGCSIVISEFTVTSEQVDAMGWTAHRSIVVECKTSRDDFLRDRKKHHRKNADGGLGDERWYLTPKGLIKPDELPDGWLLAEVWGTTVRKIVGRRDRRIERKRTLWQMANENRLLLSLARRLAGCAGEAERLRIVAMQNGEHKQQEADHAE